MKKPFKIQYKTKKGKKITTRLFAAYADDAESAYYMFMGEMPYNDVDAILSFQKKCVMSDEPIIQIDFVEPL